MVSVTTRRRRTGRGETAALDARQVFAHAVHLADVGAAVEQGLVDALFVFQAQASAGSVSSAEPPPEIRHNTRSSFVRPCTICRMRPAAWQAGGVRHRVRGFDNFNALRAAPRGAAECGGNA